MGVTADANIVIRARETAGKEFKKLQRDIAYFEKKVLGTFRSIKSFALSAQGALAGLGLALGARHLISAYTRQEKAIAGMEQAMKSMGRYTPQLAAQLKGLASQLQAEGIFGDETILEGQKFLVTYKGITDDLLPRTTKAMADLAALTGKDMASAANIMGKASMGMTGELTRYGITLSEAAKKSKDFTKILGEIETQVAGQNAALRQTGYGGLEAFKNMMGDLEEKVGGVIVQTISPALDHLAKQLGEVMSDETFDRQVLKDFTIAAGYAAEGIKNIAISSMYAYREVLRMKEGLSGTLDKIKDKVGKLSPKQIAQLERGELKLTFDLVGDSIRNIDAKIEELGKKAFIPDEIAAAFDRMGKGAGQANKQIAKGNGLLFEHEMTFDKIETKYNAWAPIITDVNGKLAVTYGWAQKIDAASAKLPENAKKASKIYDELGDALAGVVNIIGNQLMQYMDDLVDGTVKDWRDYMKEILKDTSRMAASMAMQFATEAIKTAISTAAEGGIFRTGGQPVIPLGGRGIPFRAYGGGGISYGPEVVLRAEAGVPEAHVPLASGKIPVEIKGGGRQQVVNVYLNAGFVDGASGAAWLKNNQDQIVGMVARAARESGGAVGVMPA